MSKISQSFLTAIKWQTKANVSLVKSRPTRFFSRVTAYVHQWKHLQIANVLCWNFWNIAFALLLLFLRRQLLRSCDFRGVSFSQVRRFLVFVEKFRSSTSSFNPWNWITTSNQSAVMPKERREMKHRANSQRPGGGQTVVLLSECPDAAKIKKVFQQDKEPTNKLAQSSRTKKPLRVLSDPRVRAAISPIEVINSSLLRCSAALNNWRGPQWLSPFRDELLSTPCGGGADLTPGYPPLLLLLLCILAEDSCSSVLQLWSWSLFSCTSQHRLHLDSEET